MRGTASLVRNTLLGSFDAISKLSGALGTGVAYLSFDDRFVADRRTDFRDRRPRHIGTGLMLGKSTASLVCFIVYILPHVYHITGIS